MAVAEKVGQIDFCVEIIIIKINSSPLSTQVSPSIHLSNETVCQVETVHVRRCQHTAFI